jgi:hypothetical protein
MWILWPLMLGLGYYFAPILGIGLWLKQLWQLRSGWLRALTAFVLIISLSISLNSQAIPSYNPYWMLVLGAALFLPQFLPNNPQARPYILATHAVLLAMSLALHIWYSYLYQRPQFDSSFSYYALPCLSLCLFIALLINNRQKAKTRMIPLLIIAFALLIGLALGQFFYAYA